VGRWETPLGVNTRCFSSSRTIFSILLYGEYRPPPVGELDIVREKISKSIPNIDWTTPRLGGFQGDGFFMEFEFMKFKLQKDDIVQWFKLRIYGGGNPLPLIHKLCSDNDWFAFDTSSGWLGREVPSDNGCRAVRDYKNELIETFINNDQE